MAIIIKNMTPDSDETKGANYVVRINDETIAFFRHHPRDGIAVCLEKAAAAIRGRKE